MISVSLTKTSKPLKESTFKALLLELPMTMQKEILKYKKWEDRQRSLLGKTLLKMGLKELGEYVLCAFSTTCKLRYFVL